MNISKLDAAKEQLNTAVELYFENKAPISVHTLTAAAHQILMDLAKAKNQLAKSFIKDLPLTAIVRKGKEKEYLSIINEAENFFKHADRDPMKLLKFNRGQTEFLLLDAI